MANLTVQKSYAIYSLWKESQVAMDMDSECTVDGNGHSAYAVKQTIEAVCDILGIDLGPNLTRLQREQYLRDNDRADEIEYLGALGD